jgi:tRNA(Ile)-lysidine synthase TilS/MesJ
MDEIASLRELGACSFCGILRRRALNEIAKDQRMNWQQVIH